MATTPWVASLYADLFAYKCTEARAAFQQLIEDQARTAFVPATPRMEWDEPLRWQLSRDARLGVATLEQDTGPLPILPKPGWDEVEWQRWFGSQYRNQTQEAETGLRPIVTLLAYDESDWARRFEWPYGPQTAEQDQPSLPITLSVSWLDESAFAYQGSPGSLAAMVLMDEFVNAPSGSSPFGPAPRGRSVRFGFSTPGFR